MSNNFPILIFLFFLLSVVFVCVDVGGKLLYKSVLTGINTVLFCIDLSPATDWLYWVSVPL